MKKDVEFAREGINTRLLQPMRIEYKNIAILLHGRADKIFRNNKTLIVQDDKFPTNIKKYEERFEPFDDQKLQALTYLNSRFIDNGNVNPSDWFEILHKEKTWIIQIRDRTQGNKPFKIFKGTQNEDAANFLMSSIHRFALLVLGKEERIHHNMAAKCKPCRLFNQCQHGLV